MTFCNAKNNQKSNTSEMEVHEYDNYFVSNIPDTYTRIQDSLMLISVEGNKVYAYYNQRGDTVFYDLDYYYPPTFEGVTLNTEWYTKVDTVNISNKKAYIVKNKPNHPTNYKGYMIEKNSTEFNYSIYINRLSSIVKADSIWIKQLYININCDEGITCDEVIKDVLALEIKKIGY